MTGILLINLGTPDAPTTSAVRRYLKQFLSDPRVIDINPLLRSLLLHIVILPFRSPKSAEAYRKIWTEKGSPLLFHTQSLAEVVQKQLGNNYAVEIGMRYGSPSIESAFHKLLKKDISEIKVLPLFPQYASSSTGSALEELFRVARKQIHIPPLSLLPSFYDHPGFIESFVERGKPVLEKVRPDHVLFSFHGLPERHIQKGDPYQSHCFQTAEAIAKKIGIPGDVCSVSFQSRLGRTPWIKPYTDLVIPELIRSGKKRIVVFCPSFVADCLETLEEIGIRAKELAMGLGAETFELVPSLNHSSRWVETVCEMVA